MSFPKTEAVLNNNSFPSFPSIKEVLDSFASILVTLYLVFATETTAFAVAIFLISLILVLGFTACVIKLAFYWFRYEDDSFPGDRPSTQSRNSIPPALRASDHTSDKKHHLLLCATGSVATIKLPLILHALSHHPNLSIRIILSKSATNFLQAQSQEQPSYTTLTAIPNVDAVYLDEDEWRKPWVRGDGILHIELRKWADLMVVAPLSANAMAKLANGMSEDLISSVARAWDTTGKVDEGEGREGFSGGRAAAGKGKLMLLAPAMNTAMWMHPVTRRHLGVLEEEWRWDGEGGWIEVLRPMAKALACGDVGAGAMMEWKEIVGVVERRLGLGEEEWDEVGVKEGSGT
ncbi:hypothetical protein MBLNU230_g1469t1 [Neophaeotheca triangularis]